MRFIGKAVYSYKRILRVRKYYHTNAGLYILHSQVKDSIKMYAHDIFNREGVCKAMTHKQFRTVLSFAHKFGMSNRIAFMPKKSRPLFASITSIVFNYFCC